MISVENRELVIRWFGEGKTQESIAGLVGCSQSAVSRLISKYQETGSVKNLRRSGRPTPLTNETLAKLKEEFVKKAREANKNYCSIDTKQFARLIEQRTGKKYSARHAERVLHRLDFSRITPRPKHVRNDSAKVVAFREEY